MNSNKLKVWIPAGVTLVASHIVKYNAPELIASEGFRYFSLFILLSGLSSALLVALALSEKISEKMFAIFYFYTVPTMFYTLVFIGDDFDNIKFIMSFF